MLILSDYDPESTFFGTIKIELDKLEEGLVIERSEKVR